MSDPAPLRQNRDRARPAWFVASVILHAAAAIALLLFTPLRQIILEEQPQENRPDVTMASHRLEDVSQQMEQINRDRLERDVQDMHEMLDAMEQVRHEQANEFELYERQMIEQTPEQVPGLIEQALEAMDAAIEALEKTNSQETDAQQAQAESLQQEALARLEAIAPASDLSRLQQEALAAQRDAIRAHADYRQAKQQAQQAREATERTDRTLETEVKKQEERQTRRDEAAAKVEQGQLQLAEERSKHQELEAEGTNAKAVAAARQNVQRLEAASKRDESALAQRQQQLEQTQARVEELQQSLRSHQQRAVDGERLQERSLADARRVQSDARARQQQAAAEIKQKVGELAAQAMAKHDRPQEQETSPPPDVSRMDVLQLYDAAQEAETKVTEQYREIRAMKLAMLREATLDQARDAIEAFKPIRPQLDAQALQARATTTAQFERKRQQLETAVSETGAMLSLANLLLSQAKADMTEVTGEGGAISLDAIEARSAAMQALETLASVDVSGTATDVTAAMMAVTAAAPQRGEASDTREAATAPRPNQAPPVATVNPTPPTIAKEVRPVPGRKVGEQGDATTWMAVNTWYIIGPWPNPGRANMDRSFPPENLVDLDATYIGKDGRTIRWEFVQSDSPRGLIVPTNSEEYGIWYACTELHFDRPRDLWVAMGSDDKGRLWINDVPVWVSADQHKNWDPGEAYRRVHFQQGRNRILLRCENGWHGMGFSLWVYLPENSPPPGISP